MNKFKVGDMVKVLDNKHFTPLEDVGTTLKVIRVFDNVDTVMLSNGYMYSENSIELV